MIDSLRWPGHSFYVFETRHLTSDWYAILETSYLACERRAIADCDIVLRICTQPRDSFERQLPSVFR